MQSYVVEERVFEHWLGQQHRHRSFDFPALAAVHGNTCTRDEFEAKLSETQNQGHGGQARISTMTAFIWRIFRMLGLQQGLLLASASGREIGTRKYSRPERCITAFCETPTSFSKAAALAVYWHELEV